MYQDLIKMHARAEKAKSEKARRVEEMLRGHLGTSDAVLALPWLASTEDILRLAEAAQRAVERLGRDVCNHAHPIELLTSLGTRTLGALSTTHPSYPEEVRRREAAYVNQRCGARAAALFASSRDLDRRLHRMSLRDLS